MRLISKLLLLSSATVMAAPAAADVRARYDGVGGAATVEVDDNGDMRLGGEDGGSYSLFTAAGDYVVFQRDGGPAAARYEDFRAVIEAMTAALGLHARSPAQPPAESPLIDKGRQMVAGYSGTRFEWTGGAGQPNGFAIVSDSPELRPLGRAMAKLLSLLPTFEESMGGPRPAALAALGEMLGSAALLQLDEQFALAEVSFAPLPADRFALPPTVLSREEVAAMLDRTEGGETGPDGGPGNSE
jgi:hypothetical protein